MFVFVGRAFSNPEQQFLFFATEPAAVHRK